MENPEQPPKPPRRVRYKGTHPRAFKEKYKELQPEIYADDVAKVKQQGRTPAGMHRSIMVDEILDRLQIQPGQVGLDATLGYGGHSTEMLKKLLPGGRLIALDVDPIELPRTRERLAAMGFGPEVLTIKKINFAAIDVVAEENGPFDFILADLGVSSMQIDNPDRGFSYKVEGPLDLRLDPRNGKPASHLLQHISQTKLEAILSENADEPHAARIAAAIITQTRKGKLILSTSHLAKLIADTLEFIPKHQRKDEIKKSCQRTFQALRIEVNEEFRMLDKFLIKLPDALAPGGRVAILTFHSGEDRRVKKAFQTYFRDGTFSEIVAEPERPTAQECNTNPRAKSAKLRWAVKSGSPST